MYFSAMFIRASRSGPRTYLRLVESYRDEHDKNRHRQIGQLGRIEDWPADKVESLVSSLRGVTGHERPPAGSSGFEAAREFGDPWALTELWMSLGLSEALKRALRSALFAPTL